MRVWRYKKIRLYIKVLPELSPYLANPVCSNSATNSAPLNLNFRIELSGKTTTKYTPLDISGRNKKQDEWMHWLLQQGWDSLKASDSPPKLQNDTGPWIKLLKTEHKKILCIDYLSVSIANMWGLLLFGGPSDSSRSSSNPAPSSKWIAANLWKLKL